MKTLKTLLFLSLLPFLVISQESSWRWQQEVDYTMVIDVNVENYTYKGTQNLVFTNNSPDDLDRVFTTYTLMLLSPELISNKTPGILLTILEACLKNYFLCLKRIGEMFK